MKWLKKTFISKNYTNDDLFGFDDAQGQDLNVKIQKKAISTPLKTNQEKIEELKELSKSAKDFKRNNINKTGKKQVDLNLLENTDIEAIETINGTKKGLSKNNGKITQEQIEILKQCKKENTATELRKISKRTNKTKFKKSVLDPLIDFGFFELTIPDSRKSPNQKYRLTEKFVRRIQKN